jgi:hypothetical protein
MVEGDVFGDSMTFWAPELKGAIRRETLKLVCYIPVLFSVHRK